MSKKSEIMRIWQECFPGDSAQWRRMFFDAAYSDEETLTLCEPQTGATISSMFLLSYSMTFHNRQPGVAYIYGAGTLRKYRAQGYMARLMRMALRDARDRGDTFAALIPASGVLRLYYRRFDFASAFFYKTERYTSVHRFDVERKYLELIEPDVLTLYPSFERMMAARSCCVQHTLAQFLTLMDDVRLSGDLFVAVADEATGEVCGMAWGSVGTLSDDIVVKELLAEDEDAANATLAAIHNHCPDRPLTVMRPAPDTEPGGNLVAGGMARVVNVEAALAIVAEAHPEVNLTIKVRDSILPENDGIYHLDHGTLKLCDGVRCNLEVTPDVLTSLLFSSRPIADVTGLPASRPSMSLMLD